MYRNALLGPFADTARLVALCDANAGRLAMSLDVARARSKESIGGYAADEFDTLLAERGPQTVIVTSMDCTHDEYICRAMAAGCDVITEKPLTISAPKLQRILDTRARTGRKLTVAFNYRYSPVRSQVKRALVGGVVGEITAVDFQWLLDTRHGADYFRRWHRNKANSGGLLVHKATHHFDLVNWWLESVPQTVHATGERRYYRPEQAQLLGLEARGERCHGCAARGDCPFHFDITARDGLKAVYFDQERHDGYQRDRCVFSAEIEYRGHDERARPLLERCHDDLLALCLRTVGGLSDCLQRHVPGDWNTRCGSRRTPAATVPYPVRPSARRSASSRTSPSPMR